MTDAEKGHAYAAEFIAMLDKHKGKIVHLDIEFKPERFPEHMTPKERPPTSADNIITVAPEVLRLYETQTKTVSER